MSNKNEKARFNCRVDKDLLDDYKKVVPNASEDIREYMQRRVNQKTNLQELQKLRLEKIKERDLLNIEIEELEEDIAEAKRLRHENNLNKQSLSNAMEIVINVSESGKVKGITRDKVKEIAESNDVNPNELYKECKKHDIKFITKRMAEVNSTIRKENKTEKPKDRAIINAIKRDYKQNKSRYNNDFRKFLDDQVNQNKYKIMAETQKVDYDELISKVEKLHQENKI